MTSVTGSFAFFVFAPIIIENLHKSLPWSSLAKMSRRAVTKKKRIVFLSSFEGKRSDLADFYGA